MTSRLNVNFKDTSRWVWALLVLAVVWVVLALVSAPTMNAQVAYGAFIGAAPALFAAALMYVAPHERETRIAAFAFALPVLVNALIGAGILVVANVLSANFSYLGPRLAGVASGFGYFSWIFPIVAVYEIAQYIGPVRDRVTTAIVGVGVVMAILQTAAILASAPAGLPIEQLVTGVLAQSVWIAWAYLLAAAFSQSMPILGLAAIANLLSGALTFLSFSLLQSQLAADSSAPAAQGLLAILWVLGVIAWVALLTGILRELPRVSELYEPEPLPRVLSVGR